MLLVGSQHLFVAADGQEHPIDGIRSAFPPLAGPVVPVVSDGATVTTKRAGWWRPGQPIDHLPHEVEVILHVSPTEPRMVFGSRDAAGRRVVVDARPAGFETRPWPSDGGPPVLSFASGDWQGTDYGAEVTRWNVLTGEMSRLTWALPAGMRRLGGPFFGADGALVVALRNDYTAGVYLSTAAGPDWVRLGKTLGEVETVEVTEVGGTYVIDTKGIHDFFVPQQQWQPAPAGEEPDLRGRSHQIVRPADGISVEANPPLWRISLSPDGLRALYWETAPGGYTLVMHDLTSRHETPAHFSFLPRLLQCDLDPLTSCHDCHRSP